MPEYVPSPIDCAVNLEELRKTSMPQSGIGNDCDWLRCELIGESPAVPGDSIHMRILRFVIILGYLFVAALPLVWMGLTSIKHVQDTISRKPKFIPAAHGRRMNKARRLKRPSNLT